MMRNTVGLVLALSALAACKADDAAVREQTRAEQAGNSQEIARAEDAGQLTPGEIAARKAAATSDDKAPYKTDLPLSEFMPHVMQYAGDGIWKRQGFISDSAGTRSLFPKNEEEWEEAESASLALAEMTNVLLVPGRRVPDREWDKAVLGVRAVALKAAAAAEKKNADAFFAAGGELDEACDYCHERFDPKFQANQSGT